MEVSGSTSIHNEAEPYFLAYYDESGYIEYWCTNRLHGASTSATDWRIKKFTRGDDGITVIEELVGSVDNRSSLDWI